MSSVIDKVVEMLDLREVYGDYAGEGNPPYHPQTKMKALFYVHYCGLMSCHGVCDGLTDRADFIFLSGGSDFRPSHGKLLRHRHTKALPKLFAQIVMICGVRLHMLDFQRLAIDTQRSKRMRTTGAARTGSALDNRTSG